MVDHDTHHRLIRDAADAPKATLADIGRRMADTGIGRASAAVERRARAEMQDIDDADAAVRRAIDQAPEPDAVNHPPHYTSGNIECIDAIEAAMTTDEFVGFCRGNAMKYVWRAGRKGDAAEDLRKAAWYLERAVVSLDDATM